MKTEIEPCHNTQDECLDHIPQQYEPAFWMCAVCGKELHFVTEDELKKAYDRGVADEKARRDGVEKAMVNPS